MLGRFTLEAAEAMVSVSRMLESVRSGFAYLFLVL
jgi:hypothetical protein